MKQHLKSILALGIITLGLISAQAGEQRLVGYANGKPLYVSGGPIVRQALPANRPAPVQSQERMPVRVNMGSSQCYHGPVANSGYAPAYGWGGGGYYGGGYYDVNQAYGGYGYTGYGHVQVPCRQPAPYVNPYPAAASRGYSWIPRYGASTHIPQYK